MNYEVMAMPCLSKSLVKNVADVVWGKKRRRRKRVLNARFKARKKSTHIYVSPLNFWWLEIPFL